MTINSIITSLDEVKVLLTEAGLWKQENTATSRDYLVKHISEEFRSVMYLDDYENIYKTALKCGDYFCILSDDSFIRFNATKEGSSLKLSYSYCPNPRDYKTYEEFIKDIGFEEFEETDMALEEYDQYRSEAKLNSKILPIRYDYDEKSHTVPDHATSHIHFGFFEHVRIPVAKILSPQAFTILIIKNLYYQNWKECHDKETYKRIETKHKKKCSELLSTLFCEEEKKYLYFM